MPDQTFPVIAAVPTDCLQAEGCPAPTEFQIPGCQDSAVVSIVHTGLPSLGRIVQADVTIGGVCPGRRVAVAVILTEVDAQGMEHNRGVKSILLPPQTGEGCRDVRLNCVTFVVPEELDEAGTPCTICDTRSFRIRVLSNYVDTDFVCCESQTVSV